MAEKKAFEGEVMGGAPMELLGAGNTIVRFENETQMAIAVQRPRNLIAIRDEALAELAAFPDMAENVVYLAPVGKKKVTLENGSKEWVMQYAEELNIRAAENLFRLWGNAATGAIPLSEDDDKVSFMTVYLDYQTNARVQRFGYASKKYKTYDGTIKTTEPDRFAKRTLPGAISRVLRETILRSLPHGLKEAYKEKAYEIFGKKYTPEECTVLWKSLVKSFGELNISESELGMLSGKPGGEKLTARDILKMRALYKQIKSGDTTKQELLGSDMARTKAAMDDQLKSKKRAQADGEEAFKSAKASVETNKTPGETKPKITKEDLTTESMPGINDGPKEPEKKLTVKERLIKELTPYKQNAPNDWLKAVSKVLEIPIDSELRARSIKSFTQRELQSIKNSLAMLEKGPESAPVESVEPTQPEAADEPPQADSEAPESVSEAQETVVELVNPEEAERKKLCSQIRDRACSIEAKERVVLEVVWKRKPPADVTPQQVRQLAENPEQIQNTAHLKAIAQTVEYMPTDA